MTLKKFVISLDRHLGEYPEDANREVFLSQDAEGNSFKKLNAFAGIDVGLIEEDSSTFWESSEIADGNEEIAKEKGFTPAVIFYPVD